MPKPKGTVLKGNESKRQFGTPITIEVLEAFQKKVKSDKLPINVVVETFMKQYANGEFELKFVPTEEYAEKYLSVNQ